MSGKIELFSLNSILDSHVIQDILLRTILDTYVTQSQRNILASEHALSIGTLVHDINLSQDSDGSNTTGIDLFGHHETI